MLDVAPSQDASDHQDYYMFRIGDSELNLHFPLLQGGGHIQYIYIYMDVSQNNGTPKSSILIGFSMK